MGVRETFALPIWVVSLNSSADNNVNNLKIE